MGTLRKIRSEGTMERRADALDEMDLPYGVPCEGVPLVLYHKEDDTAEDTISVEFKATRSDFLEKIRKAWRDYASHPEVEGKPARMAIEVDGYINGEECKARYTGGGGGRTPRGTDWLIQGEMETQEAANALWDGVVKMWTGIKDMPWLRNA